MELRILLAFLIYPEELHPLEEIINELDGSFYA